MRTGMGAAVLWGLQLLRFDDWVRFLELNTIEHCSKGLMNWFFVQTRSEDRLAHVWNEGG